MFKEYENKKGGSKSPALSHSPNYLTLINIRKSTSPKRYYLQADQKTKKLSKNSKNLCKSTSFNQSSESISNENFSNRVPLHKPIESSLATRKSSPLSLQSSRPPLIPTKNSKQLIALSKPLKSSKPSTPNYENQENLWFTDKKSFSIRNSQKRNIKFQRVPLACRSSSVEKRKFPARYLKTETLQSKPQDLNTHIQDDLKLLYDTNSSALLKDLETAKLNRLRKDALKKYSILKDVNEEESWDWSSPEHSPAKRVRFKNS